MAQSRADASRKSKPADGASAKQRQLEGFVQQPESVLTTGQGVVVPDNHNTLRAGLRGPALLQDFVLLENLTHFDL
jgi:catalase